MIKVILDYDEEPMYCGSVLWFDEMKDAFDFIGRQNSLSRHSYYIVDEEVEEEIRQMANGEKQNG